MKVVYPTCCGVDVHKSFLVATIIKTNGLITPGYSKKRFSTFNGDILRFKQWLLDNDCHDVCMESTGKYWIPVYNLLEDSLHVVIASPKWVKAVKGCKDDDKDSKWIGDLFRLGLVPGSFIPPKPIRILREYTRYRYKLVSCRTSEKNRFQNALTVCNVALDSVVSDVFGVSASKITDYLINNSSDDDFDAEHVKSLLKRSLKAKGDEVVEAIRGYKMTLAQKQRMTLVNSHMDFIEKSIDDIDAKLDELVKPYEPQIAQLCTIPGVDRRSAVTIISEIGVDMSQFDGVKRFCCWAGLTPSNNQSAGKKKSVRLKVVHFCPKNGQKRSQAGVYLKPALVQVAHAAVKSTVSPYYKTKYDRISKRRGKKRAIIAIARMILTAAYQMFKTGEAWNPSDLCRIDMPPVLQEQQKQKAIKNAAKLLIAQGLIDPAILPPELAVA